MSGGPTESQEQKFEDLMERYQQGDSAAGSELVERLSPQMLRFFARPALTRSYAEDMLQECWLRIHKARGRYRRGAPVLSWILAIARYTRCDRYRDLCRSGSLKSEPLEEFSRCLFTPFQLEDVYLWQLVARLPEGQREVILMLKVCGMSLEEIARALGTSTAAVKQKAHRAYGHLRDALSGKPSARSLSAPRLRVTRDVRPHARACVQPVRQQHCPE